MLWDCQYFPPSSLTLFINYLIYIHLLLYYVSLSRSQYKFLSGDPLAYLQVTFLTHRGRTSDCFFWERVECDEDTSHMWSTLISTAALSTALWTLIAAFSIWYFSFRETYHINYSQKRMLTFQPKVLLTCLITKCYQNFHCWSGLPNHRFFFKLWWATCNCLQLDFSLIMLTRMIVKHLIFLFIHYFLDTYSSVEINAAILISSRKLDFDASLLYNP